MVTEACATGKPVHVVHLDGGNKKFKEFHGSMQAAGYTRPFQGHLEHWRYRPANEAAKVARRIHELLRKKSPTPP